MTGLEKAQYDVFFYEAFEEEAEQLKQFLDPQFRAGYTWKTIQEEGSPGPPAELISTRTQSVIPLDWSNRLRGILSRSTGYNHLLDYKNSVKSKLTYGYLPLYCNRAVAEQALLLWMAILRKLQKQKDGFQKFQRDGLTGSECEHKNLLVAGVGNIGYQVIKIGRGMGMRVSGVDIVKRNPDVDYVNIREAIGRADVIVCAMNLTAENEGYFNYDLLKRAKHKAIFINIARGELSPSNDLLRLIKEGRLGGIGLDVFQDESDLAVALRGAKSSANPAVEAALELSKFPNVILTPHNAFNTEEAVQRKSEQSARQVASFLSTGKFIWPIPLK